MAQAVQTTTVSAFIAKLLAPAAASPTSRDGKRYLTELKREMIDAWRIVELRYWAAHSYRAYASYSTRAAEIEARSLKAKGAADEIEAESAMLTAVNRMMMTPAPTIGALRHKQKLRGYAKGRQRWEDAIAADEARLLGGR